MKQKFILIFIFSCLSLLAQTTNAWNNTVKPMGNKYTSWTWTGAVSNDWNNGSNWCGSYINGLCRGQTTAPPATAVVVFNDLCTANCTPTISANVSIRGVSIQPSFSGSISLGTYTMNIGTAGYYQGAGTFNVNTGQLLLGSTTSVPEFRLSGGTFNGGSGTLSAGIATNIVLQSAGTFHVTGGTLNLSSGVTRIQATSVVVQSAATVTNGGGTLYLDVGNNWMTLNVAPNHILNHVVLTSPGSTKRFTMNADLTIAGNLTIENLTTAPAIINGTGKFVLTQGNFIHKGYDLEGITKIKFTGSGLQIVDNTQIISGYPKIIGIEIANQAGGTVRFDGNLTLRGGLIMKTAAGTANLNGASFTFSTIGSSAIALYDCPQITFPSLTVDGLASGFSFGEVRVSGDLSLGGLNTYLQNGNGIGVIKVGGDVNTTSGFRSDDDLKLELNGTGAQTINVSGSTNKNLPSLRFNKLSGAVSFNGDPYFSGHLTHVAGTVNWPTDVKLWPMAGSSYDVVNAPFTNLTLYEDAEITATTDIHVTGNLTVRATSSSSQLVGRMFVGGNITAVAGTYGFDGSGNLILNGSTSQTLDYTAQPGARVPKLEFSSTGGTVTALGTIRVSGTLVRWNSGVVNLLGSTLRFVSTSNVAINPGTTLEFGDVDFATSNNITINTHPMVIRGYFLVQTNTASKTITGDIVAYGNVHWQNTGYAGTTSLTLKGDDTTFTRTSTVYPNMVTRVEKNAGKKVSLVNSVSLGNGSLNVVSGSVDIAGAANVLTLNNPGTVTLATGTSIILSGGTLSVGGASIPAGPYSSGNIVP